MLMGGIGTIMLYSAAGQNVSPWAIAHITRLGLGAGILLAIAMVPIRMWLESAYILYIALIIARLGV